MKAQFYHWFVDGKVLHIADMDGDKANLCGIEGWDMSGWHEEVRCIFGKDRPPICKRCLASL